MGGRENYFFFLQKEHPGIVTEEPWPVKSIQIVFITGVLDRSITSFFPPKKKNKAVSLPPYVVGCEVRLYPLKQDQSPCAMKRCRL